ncbi:MAG: aminotransferase class III-fold pyridoxal phosphate-dependent enzyme, partial [Betaproteobacteria bacterium]|nr:aminotransferase class III-fold pyridoxal phosphate-dependent enzyme [Betaproteobacteria bacterium]
ASYAPLLHVAASVPTPELRDLREPAAVRAAIDAACAELEARLQRDADSTAAVIVEPLVQCAAGFVFHPPEYLARVHALCRRHEVHLVADEIAVGMGRTGSFSACEQAGVKPDFLCLGKGLTGGFLPLSVVLTTPEVYQAFYDDDIARAFLHSHSYTGNALACAAALATLDLLDEPCLAANRALAERLDAVFEPLHRHPRLRHARRIGMIWAWDVLDAPADFARRFGLEALERGALLRPIGSTLYFMPPYVIDEAGAEHLLRATLGALQASLSDPVGSAAEPALA